MLIRFAIENWMSFEEKTTFSMIATREKQHADRATALEKVWRKTASGSSDLWRKCLRKKQPMESS